MTRFSKPATTFEQQRELIRSRGLEGRDDAHLERLLSTANYYRLSAYWYTFREVDRTTNVRGEQLAPGCTLDLVWERYCFDRKLRLLVLDAIERIEIHLRTQLAYHHAHAHGPFGYIDDEDALPKLKGIARAQARAELMSRISDETTRAQEVFVRHFFKKYGDQHGHLPIWVATEVMTFRTLITIYENCTKKVKAAVAASFGMIESIFWSWLVTINTVRNVCAHHGRLWNRELGTFPSIPTGAEYRDWNTPVLIRHRRMFSVLTMLNYCVERVAPEDHWAARFRALIDRHPVVPIRYMGFPDNWTESPLWAGARVTVGADVLQLPNETPFPPG